MDEIVIGKEKIIPVIGVRVLSSTIKSLDNNDTPRWPKDYSNNILLYVGYLPVRLRPSLGVRWIDILLWDTEKRKQVFGFNFGI